MKILTLLLSLASVAPGSADTSKPTIVLVHGAFADGSSWARVIPLLENDGYTVIAVQNPLTSSGDDVATTKRVIEAQKGPVVDRTKFHDVVCKDVPLADARVAAATQKPVSGSVFTASVARRGMASMLENKRPESVFAYEGVWPRLAQLTHLVAIDLPGFCRSERM
jgi:hypothetical protein